MRLTTSGPPSRSTSSSDSTHSWISTDSNSETLTCPPLFIVSPSSVTFNAPTIRLWRGAKPGPSQEKRIERRVRRPYIAESPIQNALVRGDFTIAMQSRQMPSQVLFNRGNQSTDSFQPVPPTQ